MIQSGNQSAIIDQRKQNRISNSVYNQQQSLIVENKRRQDQEKFISLVKIYDQYEKKRRSSSQNFNMLTNFNLKTKKEQDQIVEQKNNNRRSRKDKQGRDYICGCGKSYLSYPALYTHIKQKHEGKQPENTTRLNSNGPSKRGRPRRMRVQESIHSIQQNPKTNQLPKVLVNKINKNDFVIFEQYEDTISGSVLAQEFIEFPKFVDQIEAIKKQNIKELQIEMSIDRVMTIYLYNMAQVVNLKFFTILEELLVYLRHCLNLRYKKMHESYQKISGIYSQEPNLEQNDKTLEYCQKSCSQLIPLISEYFILKFLPNRVKSMDIELVKVIISDFCSWLYFNKLTHLKLSTYSPESLPNIDIGEMEFQ